MYGIRRRTPLRTRPAAVEAARSLRCSAAAEEAQRSVCPMRTLHGRSVVRVSGKW